MGKKFKKIKFNKIDVDFDEWNEYALKDGWVCRNDLDCNWIDQHLGCDDREFQLVQIKV